MRAFHVFASVVSVLPAVMLGCEPSVATIEVDPVSVILRAKDESKTLKATPKKETGELAVDALLKVKWASSDPGIASVSSGTVIAHKSGDTLVTASVGDTKATAKVIVSIAATLAIEPSELTLQGIGKSADVKVVAKDENGKDALEPQIVWATSSSSIAMVTGSGKVEAAGAGNAVLTAKVGQLEARTVVQVRYPQIARIDITPGQRELDKVGDAVRLTATLYDAEGGVVRGVPVEWSTADDKVATISNEGLVTAVKKGKVKVSAVAREKTETIEIDIKGLK
jgi:uncharacterized protein YjdB